MDCRSGVRDVERLLGWYLRHPEARGQVGKQSLGGRRRSNLGQLAREPRRSEETVRRTHAYSRRSIPVLASVPILALALAACGSSNNSNSSSSTAATNAASGGTVSVQTVGGRATSWSIPRGTRSTRTIGQRLQGRLHRPVHQHLAAPGGALERLEPTSSDFLGPGKARRREVARRQQPGHLRRQASLHLRPGQPGSGDRQWRHRQLRRHQLHLGGGDHQRQRQRRSLQRRCELQHQRRLSGGRRRLLGLSPGDSIAEGSRA